MIMSKVLGWLRIIGVASCSVTWRGNILCCFYVYAGRGFDGQGSLERAEG